jgi:hypothetical protein
MDDQSEKGRVNEREETDDEIQWDQADGDPDGEDKTHG